MSYLNCINKIPIIALLVVLTVLLVWHHRDGGLQLTQNTQTSHSVEISSQSLRRLSLTIDLDTRENLRTINGTIPEVSCPVGHYRPSGSTKLHRVSGNRQDGCFPCPKGRYGDTMGLVHSTCTAACPVGTYSDEVGLTSINECKKCPKGTFGKNRGLTSKECSGVCPRGRYTDKEGSTSCKVCPKKYYMHQCPLDDLINPKP